MAELELSLAKYDKKRDLTKTHEPKGKLNRRSKDKKLKSFVVQKHDASRLHYDFRIESESAVLISWAVPKGPSMDPSKKRLAIKVEDHPLDYLNFEGVIPPGNYGAGTVIVWDIGTYGTKDSISKQLQNGKISLKLEGKKLRGGFTLIRTRSQNQWLLIKENDGFASKEDLTITHPGSVLQDNISSIKKSESNHSMKDTNSYSNKRENFFSRVAPMLASPVANAFNDNEWVFEIKWDGVRAILFKENDKIKLQSRSGNDITDKYPEVVTSARECLKECKSTVIDGEIVVLDENGNPSFQAHQRRMNVENKKEILVLSSETPCTFYAFDVLYHEYEDFKKLSYLDRRSLLSQILVPNDTIKISDYIEEKGIDILKHSKALGLEGIMAKRKSSVYREGVRSRAVSYTHLTLPTIYSV